MAASKSPFWTILGSVVVLDFITKRIAEATLTRFPRPILGDWFTFQLVYNPGAAFGINLGPYSRWVFMGLAIAALAILGSMVRSTSPAHWLRLTALGLICGGAVGNLVDRFTSARGVVDFIDVGVGTLRWPTFNVADIAVTCGAVALAMVLWQEGKGTEAARVSADP
ncbi:MAG: signal peptidase II [Gemmatimonadales bacterium]